MKLGIKITVFLILMVGRLGVCVEFVNPTNLPATHSVLPKEFQFPTQEDMGIRVQQIPVAPEGKTVNPADIMKAILNPLNKNHIDTGKALFELTSKGSSDQLPLDARKYLINEVLQKDGRFFGPGQDGPLYLSTLAELGNKGRNDDNTFRALTDMQVMLTNADRDLTQQSGNADDPAAKAEKEAQQKVAQDKAAKEKAAQDAQLQAIQQQALLAAAAQAQQGNQGGGGSGSGSGSGGSKGSSSPQSPSSSNDSQPKHDNLADQLSKAFSQNNQNQNLSSLFNNNNSSSSNSSSEKKKEDGFKFDVTPKTSQNEVKPVAKNTLGDNSAAVDPSSQGFNPSLQNVLSGPTSVPQLISQASPNNPFALGGEGGGGGQGFSGNVKSNGGSSDGGNAQEIFSGVGKVDYGELPPPIRKASPDFGGEGGGFGESGEGGGGSTTSPKANKKESLINELVLMTDNPRAKGRGIMAFVGVQVKDVCNKPGLKKIGVCGSPKQKNRFERVSVFK